MSNAVNNTEIENNEEIDPDITEVQLLYQLDLEEKVRQLQKESKRLNDN